MTLKEKLTADFKEALKEKNEVRKNTINLARAAIKQIEIDNRVELKDEEVIPVLQKQVKMRKDALADFEKAGRTDLEKTYNEEIRILESYLPAQLSSEEIFRVVESIAAEMKIGKTKENMGKLMGQTMGKLRGLADGNTIRAVVEKFLSE